MQKAIIEATDWQPHIIRGASVGDIVNPGPGQVLVTSNHIKSDATNYGTWEFRDTLPQVRIIAAGAIESVGVAELLTYPEGF